MERASSSTLRGEEEEEVSVEVRAWSSDEEISTPPYHLGPPTSNVQKEYLPKDHGNS